MIQSTKRRHLREFKERHKHLSSGKSVMVGLMKGIKSKIANLGLTEKKKQKKFQLKYKEKSIRNNFEVLSQLYCSFLTINSPKVVF